MTSADTKAPKFILFLIAGAAAIPYCWWANAFVMVRIWDWYRPAWAPELGFKAALGVSFLVTLLRPVKMSKSKSQPESEQKDQSWTWLAAVCLAPWFVLGAARVCRFVFFE